MSRMDPECFPKHDETYQTEEYYETYQAEEQWLEENPQSFRFSIFEGNINSLKRIVKKKEADFYDEHLISKMVYGYAVSLMEGFLSDTARKLILHDKEILKNMLKEYGDEELTLNEIFHNPNCVQSAIMQKISSTTFHNIKQINKLFEILIGNPFDFSCLTEIVKIRHDIVHRDGKTIGGEDVVIGSEEVLDAINEIQRTITRLQDKIESIGVK